MRHASTARDATGGNQRGWGGSTCNALNLRVGKFMDLLFRTGASQGDASDQACFVNCDRETTSRADIDRGIVSISTGFAPLRPAGLVIIRLQQGAGETAA